MEYFVPQIGQKRLWHRKGTNLKVPHLEQPYIAPPKRRITAINHAVNIFDDGFAWM